MTGNVRQAIEDWLRESGPTDDYELSDNLDGFMNKGWNAISCNEDFLMHMGCKSPPWVNQGRCREDGPVMYRLDLPEHLRLLRDAMPDLEKGPRLV